MRYQLALMSIGLLLTMCLLGVAFQAQACPVLESRHWHAWIDRASAVDGKGRLNVTGKLDLPTPGYTVSWTLGPLDRANPPGQRIFLKLTPPEGFVIQVVTSTDLHIQADVTVLKFREVAIYCGDTLLAIFIQR